MPKRFLSIIVFITLGISVAAYAGDINEELRDAAANGDMTKVEALLAKGANVNAKDNYGGTALTLAKNAGKTEIVKILKEAGAKE
jgi:Ankyrin repeats (3 copies)